MLEAVCSPSTVENSISEADTETDSWTGPNLANQLPSHSTNIMCGKTVYNYSSKQMIVIYASQHLSGQICPEGIHA